MFTIAPKPIATMTVQAPTISHARRSLLRAYEASVAASATAGSADGAAGGTSAGSSGTSSGSTTDSGTTVQDPSNPDQDVTNNQTKTVSGTTVQLPTFAFTTVTTTVSVPDGGTVLLGGIKRLREGRSEQGIPILSKVPYISRLFKNVGIGREAQSLMMMVTPRIIIQEEEEQKLGIDLPE